MLKFKIIVDGEERVVECDSLQLVEMIDERTCLYLFDSDVLHAFEDDEDERGC